MVLADLLAERVGDYRKNSKLGEFLGSVGVVRSAEFRRVSALPRRTLNLEEIEATRQQLTRYFRTPSGTMELWPVQAAALIEAAQWRGLFAPIPVGWGKGLLSLLLPVTMEANRPLLIVPAALREQTLRKVIPEMSEHWKIPPIKVIGYSELSLAKNKNLLEEIAPDCLILDECHKVKNKTAGRTKRLVRYMNENPQTRVAAMSGTITNRSILDYWHLLQWTHKKDLSPLPNKYREVREWADALDEKVENRLAPGALLDLENTPAEGTDLDRARAGYRSRLLETPAVVVMGEGEIGASLHAHEITTPPAPEIREHLSRLAELWETPNGDLLTEGIEVWRCARELTSGFWYRWDPAPPADWLEARRVWNAYVRETLKHNRRQLDTPLQVWNESEAEPHPEWLEWSKIKDRFRPNSVPQWESNYMIEIAAEWLGNHEGIVWTEFSAFGEKLSDYTGIRYFGPGKRDSFEILDHRGPMIASIAAHGTGKNLQHFAENFVSTPPSSGKVWEQLLGRTHRNGQQADEVHFWIVQNCEAVRASFEQAKADALYIESTTGTRQKLNFIDLESE